MVRAFGRNIFYERPRMLCDINCEGLCWSVRDLEARAGDGLLRDGVRQAARDGSRIVLLLVRRIRRVRMMAAGHFDQSGPSGMCVVSQAGTGKKLAKPARKSRGRVRLRLSLVVWRSSHSVYTLFVAGWMAAPRFALKTTLGGPRF